MMRLFQWAVFIFVIALFSIFVVAAQDSCPGIVTQALEAADSACADTGRNQACYGNVALSAEFTTTEPIAFEQVGDKASILTLEKLALEPMNVDAGTWGVAIMKLQANLPDSLPGQNVTILLFGDAEIEPDTSVTITPVELTTTTSANVRALPSTDATVLASIPSGQLISATGKLEDETWIRIALPESTRGFGWVSAQLLTGDVLALPIVEPADALYGPMQAFYFRSGIDDSPCAEAPDSGILIQTPQGARKIDLRVNEITIGLGSTVFIQAQPGQAMTIYVLGGSAEIEFHDVKLFVGAGNRVSIPLDEDLKPSGPPGQLESIDENLKDILPVILLEHPVETVVQPATSPGSTTSPGDSNIETSAGSGDNASSAPGTDGASASSGSSGCSINSNTPMNITFNNSSSRTVNVYWIDYNCGEVLYNTLAPGTSYVQGTYGTHPWVVRDAGSGQLLGGPYVSDGNSFSVNISD